MEKIMDKVWMLMVSFLDYCVRILDFLFSPLEIIGPWFVIFVLTLIVVFFTRCLSRVYVTKRYLKLKKEFDHWRHVREQALKHPDKDKAKQLAKNIDQAKLNRVYYDYFFEGFLKNMITNILPILLMVAYVSKVYTPQTLFDRFGHKWVLSLSFGQSHQMNISSLFWFVICLVFSFIIYSVLNIILKKGDKENGFA